ncbi:MAG: cupin domain-containing protein [Alphaproteobacteria bacterium]|nr:cupin domain-containing protein [Alphaproteobacteria bacterium]
MKAILAASVAVIAIAAAGPALAQGSALAVAQGANTKTYDIPHGSKDQTVIITTRTLKDGQTATPHIHHGVEMSEVLSGDMEIYIKGQPMKVVHAGESFIIPREVPHDGRPVPGSKPVDLAVTLVIDKGSVPRTPVKDVLIPPGK